MNPPSLFSIKPHGPSAGIMENIPISRSLEGPLYGVSALTYRAQYAEAPALHCILRYSFRVCYVEEIRSVTLRVVNGPLFPFNRLKASEGTFLCFPVYERGRKAERNVNSVHAVQFIILSIIKKPTTCTYKAYSMYTY